MKRRGASRPKIAGGARIVTRNSSAEFRSVQLSSTPALGQRYRAPEQADQRVLMKTHCRMHFHDKTSSNSLVWGAKRGPRCNRPRLQFSQ
jgi:hypothetical protein